MKIELDLDTEGLNTIQAYASGRITIANVDYADSLIVSPNEVNIVKDLTSMDQLDRQVLDEIILKGPEIVLFGTGNQLTFPPAALIQPLTEARIGTECMDTGAACRSFNFLVGEGRIVIAILILLTD